MLVCEHIYYVGNEYAILWQPCLVEGIDVYAQEIHIGKILQKAHITSKVYPK